MNLKRLLICLISTLACAPTSQGPQPSSSPSSAQAKAPKRSYESLIKIGRAYCDAGKPQKAEKPLAQAIAQEPARPEAHGVLGYALAMQNNLKQSAAAYERARALGADERKIFQELSSVYDVQKEYNKAIQVYRDWLDSHPSDTEMKHELSLTLLLTDQLSEAIQLLTEVVEQSEMPSQAKTDLAYAYARSGQHDEAKSILTALFPKGLPYNLLIEFVQTFEKPKVALRFFDRFSIKPLDTKHQKIRTHLVGLAGQP